MIAEKTAQFDVGLLVANAGIENNGLLINNEINAEVSPMKLSQPFGRRFSKRGRGGTKTYQNKAMESQ